MVQQLSDAELEIMKIKLSPKSRTIIGCHYENRDGFAKGSSGADFFKG